MVRKDPEPVTGEPLKKGSPVSVPITPEEEETLRTLIARYQEAVTDQNRKTGATDSANVHACEIMRAGLAALKSVPAEKLRTLVNKLDRKKKGRPLGSGKK